MKCELCGKTAIIMVNGKHYCNKHAYRKVIKILKEKGFEDVAVQPKKTEKGN